MQEVNRSTVELTEEEMRAVWGGEYTVNIITLAVNFEIKLDTVDLATSDFAPY